MSSLSIGDDVTISWTFLTDDGDVVPRFLYGKIIDIVPQNDGTKYQVQYINNSTRYESKLNIELWDGKNLKRRRTRLVIKESGLGG